MTLPTPRPGDDVERPRFSSLPTPVAIVGVMAGLMWVLELISLLPGVGFERWGIRPRSWRGLLGIPVAPFIHVSLRHLIANTVSFVVLGVIIAWSNITRFLQVVAIVALTSGLGVWLFARPRTVHVGASGLVMGFFAYLVTRGFFAKRVLWIVGGLATAAVFGFLWWSLLPTPGRSWTGHVFGAAGGVLAAWLGAAADDAETGDTDSGRRTLAP